MFLIICFGFCYVAYSAEVSDPIIPVTIVNNPDDHGNDIGSATKININEPVNGSIENAGDIDFFKITVDKHLILDVYSTGDTDTFGQLLNEEGNIITTDDDSGDTKNFHLRQEVYPGTYYISVKDYYSDLLGDYVLYAKTSDFAEDDYGSDRGSAFEIQLSQKITGNIQSPGDVDYFKVNLNQSGMFEVYTQGQTDTFGTLEDAQGNTVAQDDDSGDDKNFHIIQSINQGTYYIKVRHYYSDRVGEYELYTKLDQITDDFGNDIGSAAEINTNEAKSGSIQYSGDVDFFKFKIDQKCLINAYSGGTLDTYGTIYNADGNPVAQDDDSGTDKNFEMAVQADPGTYFISVRHYYLSGSGDYTIRIDEKPVKEDDYGNSLSKAAVIQNGSQTEGSIEAPGDVDFFKFTSAGDCDLELYTSGGTDTYGYLYDSGGAVVASDDDSGEGKNFRITYKLHSGTYYIEVKHYYSNMTGDYSLILKMTEPQDYTIVSLNDGDSNTCALEYDGLRYAYIGCNTTPARIIKFDLNEMKEVTSMDLPAGENRDECRVTALISISTDTVIHASYTNPCVFTKIDTNTMEITGTLVGAVEDTNDKYIRSMVYDGKYVYAAADSIPGRIIKFDPQTMTRVDSYTFSSDQASNISAITIVGDYIVGACNRDTDQYSTIFRIRKDNFDDPPETIYVQGVSGYHSICTDGRYVYAGSFSNPIKVVKVDALAQNMTNIGTYNGVQDVESGNYSIMYDESSVIVGTWNFYGRDKLIKIDPGSMEKISSMNFLPSFPADLMRIGSYIYTCCDNSTGRIVRLVFP